MYEEGVDKNMPISIELTIYHKLDWLKFVCNNYCFNKLIDYDFIIKIYGKDLVSNFIMVYIREGQKEKREKRV